MAEEYQEEPEGDYPEDNPRWTKEDFAKAVKVEDMPEGELKQALKANFPKTKID